MPGEKKPLQPRDAVIVGYVRTPFGRHAGALAKLRPDSMAGQAIAALVERTGIDSATVDDVIMGCANQAGEDNRNVARMAVLLAGWRREDQAALPEIFTRRWVEFADFNDEAALNNLAQRIVDAAYENPAGNAPATKAADKAGGRRLMVYVPARSQTVDSWTSLRTRLSKEPSLKDCAWYGHSYSGGIWSRETCMMDVELYRECSIRVQWLKCISRWIKEALRWEAKLSFLVTTTCLADSMWTRKVSRSLLPIIRDC